MNVSCCVFRLVLFVLVVLLIIWTCVRCLTSSWLPWFVTPVLVSINVSGDCCSYPEDGCLLKRYPCATVCSLFLNVCLRASTSPEQVSVSPQFFIASLHIISTYIKLNHPFDSRHFLDQQRPRKGQGRAFILDGTDSRNLSQVFLLNWYHVWYFFFGQMIEATCE